MENNSDKLFSIPSVNAGVLLQIKRGGNKCGWTQNGLTDVNTISPLPICGDKNAGNKSFLLFSYKMALMTLTLDP